MSLNAPKDAYSDYLLNDPGKIANWITDDAGKRIAKILRLSRGELVVEVKRNSLDLVLYFFPELAETRCAVSVGPGEKIYRFFYAQPKKSAP